ARTHARPDGDPRGRAALPQALRRPDHSREVRRPRHGRGGNGAALWPGHRAAGAGGREPRGGPRRRAADQRHAQAPRCEVHLRPGPARDGRRDARRGRDGPRRPGEQTGGGGDHPRRRHRGRHIRQGRRPDPRAQADAHGARPGQPHRTGAGPRLRGRAGLRGHARAEADDRRRHRARGGAGGRRRGRPDLQHQRRHGGGRHRRRARGRAAADDDRRAGRARQRRQAGPGNDAGRGASRRRSRLDLRRHDPEGGNLRERGARRGEGRGDPRRPRAARGAAGAVHQPGRGDADQGL
ncbi:MAG: Acetylglutamate kinase, partial [uncultured Acetobacteraceae bacterium]